MRKSRLTLYILQIVLIVVLIIALVPASLMNSRWALACFLLVYSLIVKKYVNKVSSYSIHKKRVTRLMLLMAILYVVFYYIFGMYTEFTQAVVKFSIKNLFLILIPISIIVGSAENIRKTFIGYKNKISNVLLFISEVLIDILLYATVYYLGDMDRFLVAVGYVLFPSIACNLLYNYICRKYGNKPIIIYRLITILYMYIIPITPNVYIFFKSFCRMIYPALIFYILENMYGERKSGITRNYIRNQNIIFAGLLIVLTLFIMLISCKFYYGILVIGSGSMSGSIEKGDAVIFHQYNGNKLEKNDVIIFTKNNEYIVHRIVDIQKINNEYRYFTKGDANNTIDNWYVSKQDVAGVVEFKIPGIGVPTLVFSELFNKE